VADDTAATPDPVTSTAAEVPPRPARRPGLRLLWTTVLVLLVAAVALWLSSKLTWTWSRHLTPLRGNVVDSADGADAQPALVPLAVLALAAIAALLAIGGWWRRVVGVLIGLAGLATGWTATSDLSGVFGAHPTGYPQWQVFGGHVLALLAGLLMVLAAVLVVRGAGTMPRLGASYENPSTAKRRRDPDTELWQALSEGRDPTATE
jgi:hypothetical protein